MITGVKFQFNNCQGQEMKPAETDNNWENKAFRTVLLNVPDEDKIEEKGAEIEEKSVKEKDYKVKVKNPETKTNENNIPAFPTFAEYIQNKVEVQDEFKDVVRDKVQGKAEVQDEFKDVVRDKVQGKAGVQDEFKDVVRDKVQGKAGVQDEFRDIVRDRVQGKAGVQDEFRDIVRDRAQGKAGVQDEFKDVVRNKVQDKAGVQDEFRDIVRDKVQGKAGVRDEFKDVVRNKVQGKAEVQDEFKDMVRNNIQKKADDTEKVIFKDKGLSETILQTDANVITHGNGHITTRIRTPERDEPADPQKPVYMQVSDKIINALKSNQLNFKMKLHPEGLGEVTVDMFYNNNKVSISISTNVKTTEKILSTQISDLKSSMEMNNFIVSQMNVNYIKDEMSSVFNESGSLTNSNYNGGKGRDPFPKQGASGDIKQEADNDVYAPGIYFNKGIINYRI